MVDRTKTSFDMTGNAILSSEGSDNATDTSELKWQAVSPLLALPAELRQNILRYLLRRQPYIDNFHKFFYQYEDLQFQILLVNRQLYYEGIRILYGENYFRIKVWMDDKGPRAELALGRLLAKQNNIRPGQLERIQYCDLYVEVEGKSKSIAIRSAVHEVAVRLCDLTPLKNLRITLSVGKDSPPIRFPSYDASEHTIHPTRVLQPLTLLRNIAQVDISGDISPSHALFLKNIMEGNSPRDHLPKMLHALRKLVGVFPDFEGPKQDYLKDFTDESLEHVLWDAFTAEEESDVQRFKTIREDIVTRVVNRTMQSLNNLYDHDANPEEGYTWNIQRQTRQG